MRNFGKWFLSGSAAVAGGIVGFILSQSLAFYTFTQNVAVTKKIEMIHLARELTKEFYSEESVTGVYRQLRTAIEQCQPLYKGYAAKGSFTNDEINRFLGFFEDLGFYYSEGALDLRFVVCRKNYLFAGSDAGGDRAATFYSLIGTAKLNGQDPEAYLRAVLKRIAEHPINRIGELLPWNLRIGDHRGGGDS
jgi:hypothetical protein